MAYLMERIQDPTVIRSRATSPKPFGFGLAHDELDGDIAVAEVFGSSIDDPEEFVEMVVRDSSGGVVTVGRIEGY